MNNVHIVQLGLDTDVFNENAAQDSCARQISYAQYLQQERPGASLTNIVLTEDRSLRKQVIGNLTLDPQNFYRLRHIYALYKYLRKLHKQEPISVITTQEFHGIFWSGLAFGRMTKTPVVGQHHSDLASSYYRKENFTRPHGYLYERIAFKLVKAFDGIRVVNREAKKFLEAIGYKKQVGVLPVPVSVYPEVTETSARKQENKNILRVLFVGRFVRVKNVECWIRTVNQALRSGEQFEFTLIGDGPDREIAEKLCDDLGFKDQVKFAGAKTPLQLADWYTSSDVLLLTSHYEGFGRVVVEAMNYGMVPVCSNVSGPRDIIEHTVNGFLAEANPEALSKYLVELAKDPAKRLAMSESAQKTARETYSPDKLQEEWIEFLLSFAP